MIHRRPTIKSKFEPWEDARLLEIVPAYGPTNWHEIAAHFPGRNARQCRERWSNYVNPNLLKTGWTEAEDNILLQSYQEVGSKWFVIAGLLPGRSKNSVKNRYFTLQRRPRLDNKNPSSYPTVSPSMPASANEDRKTMSDAIPEFSEWPDSFGDETLFGWDFQGDHNPFSYYF
jgi:hypothetical protein